MRVLYDDKNLYVGVDCEQLNAPIVRRLARRDSQIPSDGVWIDIDSRRTGVGAFHFAVNAAGMLSDGIHFDDTAYSSDWDAVWEAKVADTDRGYAIEFRIPLSVLRFSARRCRTGASRCAASSTRARRPTTGRSTRAAPRPMCRCSAAWTTCATSPRATRWSCGRSRSGASGTAPPTSTPTRSTHGWSADGSVGLDARAHVTNELTLDAALNPDFGQVEADTVVLNLSTFETILSREAPVLPGGDRRLRDGAPAGLHAAHRPAARLADAGATARRWWRGRIRRRSTAQRRWSGRSAPARPSA